MIQAVHSAVPTRAPSPGGRLLRCGAVLCGSLLLAGAAGSAQDLSERDGYGLPFEAGESLRFRVTSSRFGEIGTAWMRVDGPERLRGREVLRLSMETRGRVMLMRYEDLARSWFDPRRLSSLRYQKEERHPLGSREESVEILLQEHRWVGRDGEGGPLAVSEPLDELSMIYFVRTLELDPGWTHTLHRHFDPERNPVRIRVGAVESLSVPAGTFAAVPVEMRVRDPRRYEGEGEHVLRLHFTADARKIPVRIESTAPWVGTVTMTLESAVPEIGDAGDSPALRAPAEAVHTRSER